MQVMRQEFVEKVLDDNILMCANVGGGERFAITTS